MGEYEWIDVGECFFRCKGCGRVESPEIGMLQKRHYKCRKNGRPNYEEIIMPKGTRKLLRKQKAHLFLMKTPNPKGSEE